MAIECPKCQTGNPEDSKFCKECATPLPGIQDAVHTKTLETPTEELTRGRIFAGRYEIIEELGKGGMGRVYRVEDKKIKKEIALKLIKPEIASDKKTIERFKNELTTARDIRHKNVCGMFDLGEEKGQHYITMEFVSGGDLKRFIRRVGQLPPGKAISIAKQICDGLTEAHDLGIVHRDLKPNNIMIDDNGNARIMDFGIARSVKGKNLTGSGVMIGTPEYMSPEQVEGKDVDKRSDIYSLGIILYEMTTGRTPFEGDTALTVAVKHKTEEPKDPKEFNSQLSEDLSRLILKCLEKDKEKRYQSASELRSEFIDIEKGIPTTEKVIPKRKPLTSKEITVTFGIKKLLVPALIFIVVVIAGLIIWQLLSKKEAIPISSGKPSLAVMYFENNTGSQDLDHYRKAISDLLITDLSQSKYLKVLSGSTLFNILKEMGIQDERSYTSKDLTKVAAQGAVEHILVGSYTKAGDTFRINVSLQEAHTGELVVSLSTEGIGEASIFSMVDDLTKRIKPNLKLSIDQLTSDLDKEVGKITTSSPEAYKLYREGRDFHNKLEYEQSISLMEKAIAFDPEFAMAYRSLAVSYGNLRKYDEQRKYMQKALDLSDRLTEHEKLLIQGDFYRDSDSTYDKAIESYKKMLELYPEETVASHNLAIIFYDIEDWEKAIKYYEASIGAKTSFVLTYTQLARAYMAKGQYDKAKEVNEDCIRKFPDAEEGYASKVALYAIQGQYDLALEEVDNVAAINPLYSRAIIYYLMGDFVKAEAGYKKWLGQANQSWHLTARTWLEYLYRVQGKFKEAKSQILQGIDLAEKRGSSNRNNYRKLAYLYLRSGNTEKALEAFEKAWNIGEKDPWTDNKIHDLRLKGWIYTEMDRLDAAQISAEEIKELVASSLYQTEIKHHYILLGMIELKNKNYPDAVDHFKKAISFLNYPYSWGDDHVFYMHYLALAYYESGDLDKARDEFEEITTLTIGRLSYGDIYAKSFYMLGKIHEQQGNKAEAIEHYEKFLSLWKDADPGLPEVDDARIALKRLAGLKE